MKGLVLPLAAIAIAGLFLPTRAHPVHAICAPMTVEEYVQGADFILTGTVSQTAFVPPVDEESPDDLVHTYHAVVAADEYLKGSGPDTVTILEPSFEFTFNDAGELVGMVSEDGVFSQQSAGKHYILFLEGEVDSLVAPGCAGSRTIDQGDQQLIEDVRAAVAAAEALPPTGSAPARDQSGQATPWLPTIASSLGLTLLAGGAWLTLRAWPRA